MLFWDRLTKYRLIALLAPQRPKDCVVAYEALDPLGIVLEVAFRTPAALEGINLIRKKHPQALILAGTVLTPHQVCLAMEAGAVGIVSPDYVPSVVAMCVKKDMVCIPGGIADVGKSLVQKAELYTCELDELRIHRPYQWIFKLFPAMAGYPTFLEVAKAWKTVYKDLTVVYTGGVNTDNLREIVQNDPHGIICGSALTRHVDDPERMVEDGTRWLSLMQGVEPEPGKEDAGPGTPERIEVESEPDEPEETSIPARFQPPEKVLKPSGKKDAVVTFGEIMLRLSPPPGLRFGQAQALDAGFGGAEANVAVALSNYGLRSRYVTVLPEHAMGQAPVNALRAYGVDTGHILRRGSRVGIYYLEHGASQRPSQVIYDRAGASIAGIAPGQVNWKAIFEDARWFHWSGITPALSDSAAQTVLEALKAAKEAGVKVSVDLNYRSKLWSREKAREVMPPLMKYVDVAIGNESDPDDVFGIPLGPSDPGSGRLDLKDYWVAAREMTDRFGLEMAAITLRKSLSASDNVWSACIYDGQEFLVSKRYTIHIVDRVGGGDAFTSGLIYGLLSGKSHREALEFAVAASCLKQTIHGDFNLVSAKEVEALATGDESGRIKR